MTKDTKIQPHNIHPELQIVIFTGCDAVVSRLYTPMIKMRFSKVNHHHLIKSKNKSITFDEIMALSLRGALLTCWSAERVRAEIMSMVESGALSSSRTVRVYDTMSRVL